MTFPKSSPLIRKSFLTNALSKCGLYPNFSGLWLVFSIDFPVVPLYFKEASSRFYNRCELLKRNYDTLTKNSRAISLSLWKCIKINKRCQTICCHGPFPAWECQQTWPLPPNFVPIINSSDCRVWKAAIQI